MSSSRVSKQKKSSSTVRRHNLGNYVETYGDIMPTKCTPCKEAGRVCRVHVRSGRCGACNNTNNTGCDIQVTASEFRRLVSKRDALKRNLSESNDELESARSALDAAHERFSTALAKVSRLSKELSQNERRAEEAIAVEDRSIREQEVEELSAELDLPSFEPFPFDDRLLMDPTSWEQFLSGDIGVTSSSSWDW